MSYKINFFTFSINITIYFKFFIFTLNIYNENNKFEYYIKNIFIKRIYYYIIYLFFYNINMNLKFEFIILFL